MKKIILILCLIANIDSFGQLTPIMYFPNTGLMATPTEVYYKPGMPAPWYNNLQKYWYYRYRLVNDFLFISETNEAGSSIPAIKRLQGNAVDEQPGAPSGWAATPTTYPTDTPWQCGSCNTLSFGDATVDLGHYIQMLATEEELLQQTSHEVTRSQYELKHALDAFDRLDDNAEQYCHDVNFNLGTFHGYPGTLTSYSISYSDRHNGFFLRDDVPALTMLDPTWSNNKFHHFNRPGLARTWTYPGLSGADLDVMRWTEGNFTGSRAERFGTRYPTYVNDDSDTYHRWEGSIGSHTVQSHWNEPAVRRYPTQESQDQLIDLNVGMALVTRYTGDAAIRNQAADALYRTIKYPFNVWIPQIHDPLTGDCVYGIKPTGTCDFAGANYYGVAMGGALTARLYSEGITMTSCDPLVDQANAGISGLFWAASQLGHTMMFDAGCTITSIPLYFHRYPIYALKWQNFRDMTFAGYYACLTNSWKMPGTFGVINTTWKNLKKLCNKDDWGRPSLPLIYELMYNPPENYRYMDYMVALDAAPTCGPYDFSFYKDASEHRPFNDEILANTVKKHWTGGDWISNPQHRWIPDCDPISEHKHRAVTFNGLDYMVLFNLFGLKQGESYLKNINNPFWDDSYKINYPDNYSIGSNSIPLYLNFLEHSALKGNYGTMSNVSVRGAKQIELKEGFDSKPNCNGCFTDIYIRDFGCDEQYTFAWIPEASLSLLPTTDEEISPWGESRMPPPDSSLMLADSLVTEEMEKHFFDSIVLAIIDSGYEEGITELVKWGVNVDSILTSSRPGVTKVSTQGSDNPAIFVEVVPNPSTYTTQVKYKLLRESSIEVRMANSVGTECNAAIQKYNLVQPPGNQAVEIYTANLPPGLYVVTIRINGKVYSRKLTVL